MKNINPTDTTAWQVLQQHYNNIKNINLNKLFTNDKNRFNKLSIMFDNQMLVDFSKNLITTETIEKLLILAEECALPLAINSMFSGKKINITENKAALHTVLRHCNNYLLQLDNKNIIKEVNAILIQMKQFCTKIINGELKGYTYLPITDIVNIGIGGSDKGPYMVTEALRAYKNHLKIHFVSNIDGTHLSQTIKKLNPATTLFLIASKSFTTQETMTNAYSARDWFLKTAKNKKYISHHFVAMSTNNSEVKKFGIKDDYFFKFWSWVGGRYSLWSSIGLSIALSIGFNNFEHLLLGGNAMDKHFQLTPLKYNIPVILALISIWYNNFFGFETEAIFPYDQNMHLFPSYLQQLNMESNGKYIDRNGNIINYQTGPIIWGEAGTNGQHAFYQLIHQGTKIVPCDFIVPVISHYPINNHHTKLLSHFFAQTEALAFGNKSILSINKKQNINKNYINQQLMPFKIFHGNRPTNSILIKKITPYSLGALIALYEHKIFTQGIILNINTFDQWGVELGKKLAKNILPELLTKECITYHDSSTNGLINQYKAWNK